MRAPKVPFTLHGAVHPRASHDVAEGITASLHPDGRTAALITGRYGRGTLQFLDLSTGALTDVLPGRTALQHVVWAASGERWAAAGECDQGGALYVGERGRAELLHELTTPTYGTSLRNDLAYPSPVLALSPDGARVVMRSIHDYGERSTLYHLDVATGDLRAQPLDPDEGHPYAQGFRADGAVVTLCASPGDTSGMAVYERGGDRVIARLQHVAGYVLVPSTRGLWALGLPRYGHHVAPGKAIAASACHHDRVERVERLAARARSTWDKQHVAWLTQQVAKKAVPFGYDVTARSGRAGTTPPPTEGARSYENMLYWDTARAARWRDDDVIVSDGIAVWRWHEDGRGLRQDLLVDDPQHATHRTARILAVSVAGDTLALLWKRDAGGAKTVLTRFDIDPALVTG